MRPTRTVLAAAVVAIVAAAACGCVFPGKHAAAKAVTPPPAPAPKPAPTPAPVALSTPQTQVQLPPPQAVDPEALAAAPIPEGPVETPVAPRATHRTVGPPAIAPQRTEPAPPPLVPQPEETRPPIGEIVAPSESKRLQDLADGHKREIRQLVDQARGRGLSRREQGVVSRIESFVKLSDQAEGKGDMREANALAERALVLAKDLQGGR